ncbi:unnamed protein product [Schistosoma curassoni]|uniref:CSTF2_hinge domain-containing protein n=1 Tax=Schistosoma curassoni TaxID=6186 RepID=A0A183JT78_9TREM|nr:unnamed protein product [Schistosoma curassoni]
MDPSKLDLSLEQQMKLIQMLADTKLTSNTQPSSSDPTATAPSVDGIVRSILNVLCVGENPSMYILVLCSY